MTTTYSPLRGRTEILRRAHELVARAVAGAGGVLLVRGVGGMGRSAFLRAVAEEARGGGTPVGYARCAAEESRTPFGVVRQLLDVAVRDARLGPGPGAPGAEAVSEALLAEALLADALSAGPLLLAVDDVQFADAESLAWLARLGRRLDHRPLLLVLTERSSSEGDATGAGVRRAFPTELVTALTLEPLGARAVAELFHDRLGDAAPGHLAGGWAAAGCGNPLLLHALLDDLHALDHGGSGWAAGPRPVALAEAVGHRLDGAGTGTAALARTVAALDPGDATPALLAALHDEDPDRVADRLDQLRRLGMVAAPDASERPGARPARFAHPLLQEAVLAGWTRTARRELRLRAAELMFRDGAPVGAVARHLLDAPVVGAEWAVDALVAASRAATAAGAWPEAAALLRRALAEPLTSHRLGQVLTQLGCVEVRTDPTTAVRHLTEALRLQDGAHDRVRVANALGTALAAHGEVPAALEVLRRLAEAFDDREELSDLVHSVQAATALIASHAQASWNGMLPEVTRRARRAPVDNDPMAHSLLTEHQTVRGTISADEAMERVRTLLATQVDPAVQPYLMASLATLAQWADDVALAEELVDRGSALCLDHPLHPAQHSLASVRAETAVMRGRYAEVAELVSGPDAGSGNTHVRAQGVIALVALDRLPEAARLAGSIRSLGVNESWEWNEFRYAEGLLLAAQGDPEGAVRDFLACGEGQRLHNTVSPVVTPWRSAAVPCLLELGRTGEALALAQEELRFAEIWGTRRVVGRALRGVGSATGGRHGLDLLDRAVTLHRYDPAAGPELAASLLAHGLALASAGQAQRARTVLREAAALAERLDTVRLRGLVGSALRAVGARSTRTGHTGPTALTASERHVAVLAAAGRSNAEIATGLHLARRTVETHLTQVYRKLGIRGRPQLAAALAEEP
ncbi:AAA family ATPase [Streptomyces sp. NPDC094032]|uniref:AAA family ATPase n=1 Tax=Streptomyces sp. NPDC094032 TaxID=3155308 RepID=UPI003319EF66